MIHQSLSPTHRKHRSLTVPVERIVMHRVGLGFTAHDVVHAFTGGVPEAAAATGHKMPYHIVVEPDGSVVQCLPFSVRGVHARKWNRSTLAVACIGDFRREYPPSAQWYAAARTCLDLQSCMPGRPGVWGHDELEGGSSDPNKQCPGRCWDLPMFLACIRHLMVTVPDIENFRRATAW